MPRMTVNVPVSVDLSDDQVEAAHTVRDAVGVAVRFARTPEVRDVATRLVELGRRLRRRPAAR